MPTRYHDITVSLTTAQRESVEALRVKGYGEDSADVVAYMIARELDDLTRCGVLPVRK